ncbi:MAG: alpha/beta fold hydrolase [Candidatus Hodarchaeales archaeon]|jgi:pimeloyl-ACP methyl ester carboxylesterase
MENLRKYGNAPFSVAVIHGGPGAGGEMAPVARELASDWGILEPIQTATSIDGQIKELKFVLKESGDLPVTLIGFSWGAWLSFHFAANYPAFVKKLLLIGSGPFEEKHVEKIQVTRLKRLNEEEREEYNDIIKIANDPAAGNKNSALARLGALTSKTDGYDPIAYESDEFELVKSPGDIFQRVWKEAAELRKSGKLLELGKKVKCPVIAIHGDYDPHPAEGVQKSLSLVLKNFHFILLENCGHKPWIERQVRDKFFTILEHELVSQ